MQTFPLGSIHTFGLLGVSYFNPHNGKKWVHNLLLNVFKPKQKLRNSKSEFAH